MDGGVNVLASALNCDVPCYYADTYIICVYSRPYNYTKVILDGFETKHVMG